MLRFGNTLTHVRIISYVTILSMLSLTGAVAYNNNPIIASIGYAHAQSEDDSSSSPSSPDENGNTETTTIGDENSSATDTTNGSSLSFRGIIASTLPVQQQDVNSSSAERNATVTQGDEYVSAGRWRMVVENDMLTRFVANFGVAKTDGSGYHKIGITNIGSDFEFTGNASRSVAHISVDGTEVPATLVPITLELHGKVLKITDINIDQGKIDDTKLAEALRIIDGQTIYGMIESMG